MQKKSVKPPHPQMFQEVVFSLFVVLHFVDPYRCLLALCWVYEARASQDPTMPRTSHVSMSVAMKRQKRSVIKLKFYVDV